LALAPEHHAGADLEGDSHIAISGHVAKLIGLDAKDIRIHCTTPDGTLEFVGSPNSKGFLSRIEIPFLVASSFNDAEIKAYRALAVPLSGWSVHLDVPIYVFRVQSVELRTESSRVSFLAPFLEVPLAVPSAAPTAEFRGYASIYREALNTNSPVYQFLCFYKMLESLMARRNRLNLEAKAKGVDLDRSREVVPRNPQEFVPWLNTIFPVRPEWDDFALHQIFLTESLGKKASHLIERELRPLRNGIAHALFAAGGEIALSADNALDAERVNKWLPLTKCLVRLLLRNCFPREFLAGISPGSEEYK
jgi:hypothetical protein